MNWIVRNPTQLHQFLGSFNLLIGNVNGERFDFIIIALDLYTYSTNEFEQGKLFNLPL